MSLLLNSFKDIIRQYTDRRVLAIGCIAYANGLPLLLTASTLGVWLKSYGLNYTSIGLFGLLHLPYTLKFLWAPLLDHVPLPFLKEIFGQRRSWLLLVQITAITGLLLMTILDPINNLKSFIACGFLVTVSAASQHILLLTYQIETLVSQNWGVGEGMSVFSYRMAILTGGAGALYLAEFFPWQQVYVFITLLMLVGLIAVLIMQEPVCDPLKHISSIAKRGERLNYALIGPFKDFMSQTGWIAILVFMLIYRLPEHLLSMMQTLFLIDLGFSYSEISLVAKTFGLGASVLGSIVGGYWIRIYGYKNTLFWGGLAHGISCLLFLGQENMGGTLSFLYLTIGIEHFFSGVALTAFFSYQLTCVSLAFAATQLALLTSFSNLTASLSKPLAGFIVDVYGWTPYLILVVLSSIPGVWWVFRLPGARS